jgi:indole-3-glycerol phosphate synthase
LRRTLGTGRDHSVNLERFGYVEKLPRAAIRVAESGISAKNCREVFSLGFEAILVGTSLLMDTRGVKGALGDFEAAMTPLGTVR